MKDFIFKNVKNRENDDVFNHKYLDYLIVKGISSCKDKKCNFEYIYNYLCNVYGNTIKASGLKKHLIDSFEKKGANNFSISDEEKNIINLITMIEESIKEQIYNSEEELYSKLCKTIESDNTKYIDIYSYFSAIEIIANSNLTIDVVLSKIYTLLRERFIYKTHYSEKHSTICLIDDEYSDLSIDYIIQDIYCLNVLSIANINTIGQLKNANYNLIDLILIFDKDFYSFCRNLTKPLVISLEEVMNEYNEALNDREKQVIKLRYGYKSDEHKTLEEVGNIYSVTRERIRQVEARGLRKLRVVAEKHKAMLNILFNILCKNSKLIVPKDIETYIDNYDLSFALIVLYKISFIGNCKYNSEYDCLYNSSFNFDEIINERLESMPLYISDQQVLNLNKLDKTIFDNNYKKYNNIFIRKNMLPRDLYIHVIKQNFPNGYRCSTGNDYTKLKKIINDNVGEIDDFPAERSLAAMLDRESSMIQCERGTFIDINSINELSDDLYQRIIDFIYENKPVVYYSTVLNKFKNELLSYEVNNQYLLKGLIDRRLPEDFYCKRDYISVGDKTICPYDKILDIIKSFDGVFSINDLRKKITGIGDYVFYNILYPEKENGLIFLENKRFIYFNKLNISDEEKAKLKNIIDEMFINLDSDTVSVRKIYARIKLLKEKYNIHLEMINHYFDLYSVIQYLFPHDYYYSRPYISTDSNISLSRVDLLRNYLNNFNSFTNDDVRKYLTRMNIRGIYSYLLFMDSMSDIFVQIDVDKMVKKDLVGADENSIRNIKKTINLLLNNFNEIDTRKFNGYSMFPKLKYGWNKYLLAGITRTFLSDDFVVDYTENKYKTTDFIIRRDSNE